MVEASSGTHEPGPDRTAPDGSAPDNAAPDCSRQHGAGPDGRPWRVVVVGTGSINVSVLPWWIGWARMHAPDVKLRLVLTRSATRFVSPDALAVISGAPVTLDVWPETFTSAPHTELVAWADAFLVYPATAHFLSRLALGLADTPSLLALQCTRAPVVVAPSLPEGLLEAPQTRRTFGLLTENPQVRILPPVVGRSWSTGRDGAMIPAPFPQALDLLRSSKPAAGAPPRDGAPPGDRAAPGNHTPPGDHA